jgi:hypothetical protein
MLTLFCKIVTEFFDMNWVLRTGLGALLTLLWISCSQAASIESYMVRDWEIGAYSDDKTKEFSHCGMAASYKNGIVLLFTIDSSKNWYMGLANSNWRLTPGERYHFDISLDNAYGKSWFGDAIDSTLLRVPLADSAALFEQFSASHLLTIRAVNSTYRFSLEGSRVALEAVAACTNRHLAAANRNPFVTVQPFKKAPEKTPGSSGDEAYYSEGAIVMTNTLSAIGATGYRMAPVETLRKDFGGLHAVWVSSEAAGSLRVAPEARSLPALAASILASLSEDCNGKFASGKNAEGSSLEIIGVCQQTNGKESTYQYVIAPRASGGAYVFSVFALDQEKSSIASAKKLSDLILASSKKD